MMEKILIIEDEKHLRANLESLLTDEGYYVVTAENGKEGIQCLVQEPFDLVITDIIMGDVGGFAVMEYVATHTLDTLVIFITGYASIDSVIAALRQGVYDYIAKPFDIDMLLIAIKRALKKARLQRETKTYVQELEQRVADRTKELQETNSRLNRSLEGYVWAAILILAWQGVRGCQWPPTWLRWGSPKNQGGSDDESLTLR